MARISPVPRLQFFDDNGDPLVGGKIYTYAAGTTTPLDTYTTTAGDVTHTNPIILDSRGEVTLWLGAALYDFAVYTADDALVYTEYSISGTVIFSDLIASNITFSVTNGPSGSVQNALDGLVQERTAGEIAAGVIPSNYYYAPGDVRRYGAVLDGVTDDYLPLSKSISSNDQTTIPAGTCAVSDMITIGEDKSVILASGASITKPLSLSSSTDPVIWLKESGSSLRGETRQSCVISTASRAPLGVIRIGLEDETETGRTVRGCRLSHVKVKGMQGDGQTTGARDVCVYIPAASGEQNYYHTIDDVMCTDSNHGIWLHGESNGHNISKVFGESLGNAALYGVLLFFQGGSDCTVSQAFMSGNGASGSGAILLKFSNLGVSRSTHNYITGIVGEMGVSGTLVESTDTGASAPVSNVIEGVDNTGGNNVNDDFWNNNSAKISDFQSVKGGIRFPQTAVTSSDSFTLDYYHETQSYSPAPYIDSATAGSGRSTTVNHAKWTRIGNICFVSLRVTMTTLGSGGSGNVRIKNGLPFASISDSGNYLGGLEVPNYENLSTGVRTISASAYPGSTDIAIYITTADNAANGQMDFATYIQATTQFYITGFYIVA